MRPRIQKVNRTNFQPIKYELPKLIQYAKQGLSHSEIAKLLKISTSGVTKALGKLKLSPNRSLIFKDLRTDIISGLVYDLLASVTPLEIKAMAVKDRFVSAGILIDKLNIWEGLQIQPKTDVKVQINNYQAIDQDLREKESRLNKLLALQAGQSTVDVTPLNNSTERDDRIPL